MEDGCAEKPPPDLRPRILIVGRRNAGKSALGQMLADHNPSWRSVATSDVTIALFAPKLGVSPEELKANKERYRAALIELSDPLVAQDCTVFVRQALLLGNVVNGIRHEAEFRSVRDWFDLTVFIRRPGTEIETSDNYAIPPEVTETCDMRVVNVANDLSVLTRAAQSILARLSEKQVGPKT